MLKSLLKTEAQSAFLLAGKEGENLPVALEDSGRRTLTIPKFSLLYSIYTKRFDPQKNIHL